MTAPTHTVGLVACGKTKAAEPAPARNLYTSPLFKAASAYAEATYDQWWIISARHRLLHPDTVIEPYDQALADLPRWRRDQWAILVDTELRCGPGDLGARLMAGEHIDVYLHAGAMYADLLQTRWRPLERLTVHTPMAGLQIGEQLRWYRHRREAAA